MRDDEGGHCWIDWTMLYGPKFIESLIELIRFEVGDEIIQCVL